MKIQFGLVGASPVWEQLFLQEGVPFDIVDAREINALSPMSVLVVNRALTGDEKSAVEGYLHAGGAVLAYAPFVAGVAGSTSRKERIEYILSEPESGNFDAWVLDAGVTGYVPREANVLRTQLNTFGMFAGKLAGGDAILLPFDVADLMTDTRTANKRFYHRRERLPSEQVSLVARGEVRHLLHRCFEYLHHVRAMPYGHLWYFPHGSKSLFAFRVDTDGALRRDVDELYGIAVDAHVGMSWFVDVKSHEPWLNHFGFMAGQEIGVHCYEHQVFPSYDANLKNLARARKAMESAGLPSEGFAAPYGMWNPGLAEAVDELGFAYSSEFSFAYDTLPLFPDALGIVYNTLQIPVHPVSIGSLRRVGYTEQQMREYYEEVINRKIRQREPLFFYHHPSHKSWEVVRALVSHAQQAGAEPVTLGEYARWWKKRLMYRCSMEVEGTTVRTTLRGASGGPDEPWLHLTMPGGRDVILPVASTIDLLGLRWETTTPMPPPADIRRIRDFDARSMLGDLYTEMMRKFS